MAYRRWQSAVEKHGFLAAVCIEFRFVRGRIVPLGVFEKSRKGYERVLTETFIVLSGKISS